jgi:hypothetical protein
MDNGRLVEVEVVGISAGGRRSVRGNETERPSLSSVPGKFDVGGVLCGGEASTGVSTCAGAGAGLGVGLAKSPTNGAGVSGAAS